MSAAPRPLAPVPAVAGRSELNRFFNSMCPLIEEPAQNEADISKRKIYLTLIFMHAIVGVFSFLFLQAVTVIGQIFYMAMLFSMK